MATNTDSKNRSAMRGMMAGKTSPRSRNTEKAIKFRGAERPPLQGRSAPARRKRSGRKKRIPGPAGQETACRARTGCGWNGNARPARSRRQRRNKNRSGRRRKEWNRTRPGKPRRRPAGIAPRQHQGLERFWGSRNSLPSESFRRTPVVVVLCIISEVRKCTSVTVQIPAKNRVPCDGLRWPSSRFLHSVPFAESETFDHALILLYQPAVLTKNQNSSN